MAKLLQLGADYHWQLDGIEFAIPERVGHPTQFVGRVAEMEFLYAWTGWIQQGLSKSMAFLGRRKVGKTLMLERLYNILYSEHRGLIPFYYEFREGRRSAKEFYLDFALRFYMQVVGYYTRDVTWIRQALERNRRIATLDMFKEEITPLTFPHKEMILSRLVGHQATLDREQPLYEYVLAGVGIPADFANTIGVAERVMQILDEFQYLNMFIDAGVEDKPCKAYMSTAEQRAAPLLITGSLMGVVSEELMRWLPNRFSENAVPKMNAAEAQAMTLSYSRAYGYAITPDVAAYIVHITNGVPGRIIDLLNPKLGKPAPESLAAVDHALDFEVDVGGTIKRDWDDYLGLAMDAVNDAHMRRITYFLCKNEGTWYYPHELQQAMGLDIEERRLRQELELLRKYDIIEQRGGRFGGVFDRTLKKVLMKNYAGLFDLPTAEFDAYFRNDNLLDYLKERVAELELSLAAAAELREKLARLQGEHNDLKGHYYEREMLLTLIRCILDNKGGLVAGIGVTAFTPTINYHLETGEEVDLVLAGETAVIMAECKHYAPQQLHKLTPGMVDDFIAKAHRLHQTHFADKALRLAFFSKYGVEPALAQYVQERGVALSPGPE